MKQTIILSLILLFLFVLPASPCLSLETCCQTPQITITPFFEKFNVPSSKWLIGADQIQINNSDIGFSQGPLAGHAQSFQPSKNILTAVAVYLFRVGFPSEDTAFIISIREELDGPELTNITVFAKDVPIKSQPRGSWVLFDFPDIIVNPGQSYYIHKNVSHGETFDNTYCWFFGLNNPYPDGDGWITLNNVFEWMTIWDYFKTWNPQYHDPDFCFITYHEEPKIKLLHHPHLFPILRLLF